ncbi:MAG TPA: TIM44-like domain-containing protein [Stellaceae bacterium]|nr:TIM44-like domain-containing protein [Stellaceae bacterium]
MTGRSPQRYTVWRTLFAVLFCLTLALTPSLAEARAGGGSTHSGMGSRGSRTFENNGAAPMGRTMHSEAPSPSSGFSPGAVGGSFFSRHPFLTGLAGGFLGSMLFGGGFFGHALGGLFTILLIGFAIFFLIRLLSGGFAAAGRNLAPRSLGAAAAPPPQRYRGTDIAVDDADLNAFQSLHAAIQEAWGRGDLGQLRQLVTPEMLSYFNEELTRNSSQGVQNVVANVNLVKAELTESWEEGDMQYATAYMRWTALDYTVPIGAAPGSPNAVVSGDTRVPTEAEEVWTFVRRRGGRWILSAIQQV